jgi:type I restriction enzyme, S subunit
MNVENLQCADVLSEIMSCKQGDEDSGGGMMNEWREATWPKVRLADCVNLLAGFPFKSQQFSGNPNDIALVKGENVSQGCILWGISKRWPVSDWEKMEKFHLLPGDVVIAMDRPWIPAGLKWSFIRVGDPKALLVQRCARLRSFTGSLDQNFLRFVIGSPGFENYVKPITTGVNVPHISGQQILDFEFTLPPLTVQQRIAGILSAYDELIENSQRRIRILEEMARSLYREWFVHFRFPGHENHPLVPSSLGDIPQGWEVKLVKDILSRRSAGTVYRDVDVKPEGAISVIDQSTNELLGFHDNEPDHFATTMTPIAIFGDHTCKMQLLIEPFSVGPNVVPFAAGSNLPTAYVFYSVNSLVQTQEYKRHWISLNAKEVVVADQMTAQRFASLIQPMLVAQEALRKVIRNLRRTRDLLLPRLLSSNYTLIL